MAIRSSSSGSAAVATGTVPSRSSVHLDAVRGGAALTVFLGHARGLFLRSGLASAMGKPMAASHEAVAVIPRMTIGHEAVVVFFVLSGYFVGGSVLRSVRERRFRWGAYLLQRMTRLWVVLIPALLVGLAVDLAGMHLLGGDPLSIYAGRAGTEVLPGLAQRIGFSCLLGNVFFLQNSVVSYLGTNVALWSLACEFWYYIQFPLLVGILGRQSTAWQRGIYVVLLAASAEVIGWRVMQYLPLWMAGCAVAAWPGKLTATLRRGMTVGSVAAMLAILVLCLRLNPYLANVWICAAFSMLLWLVVQQTERSKEGLYRRGAQALSKMSYTLYAVHFPLLVFVCAMMARQWNPQRLTPHSGARTATALAAVFCISVLLYRLFEAHTKAVHMWVAGMIFGRADTREGDYPFPRSLAISAMRWASNFSRPWSLGW